ncbi:carboxymuconolactone decarboxylase family protein [Amycolatopsis anabasis]|uniref:carboxymuconolactone decarboxylase family protein n=1 Tax=Amycolatopsis anabasis TaxID=1840409 RepID=UPI00131D9E47|nr:peroxidase-related enzyme [Amycolatopsis anabasis]
MAHIELGNDLPGIVGLLGFRPETAGPLTELAEALLRTPSTLSRGERELIASFVSRGNECDFCAKSHSALATEQLGHDAELVELVTDRRDHPKVSPKLRALLAIADRVRVSGKSVRSEDVAAARAAGATDVEIHDTVLIAAAFCMYNRYVDGLGTFAPEDPETYAATAEVIIAHGYGAVARQASGALPVPAQEDKM